MPKVSVIMPAYNAEKYIKEAVESILNQTFKDFEFIIIDDCSNDNTFSIVEQIKDERIKLFKNSENSGVAKTLNRCLELASGEYIARMDADDISLPDRLKKQVNFLENHPDISVVATNTKLLGTDRKSWPSSAENERLKIDLFFNCCICHPTIMFRKSLVEANKFKYDDKFNKIEDYELWERLIQNYRFACIQEELFLYRVHNNQVSGNKDDDLFKKYLELKTRIVSRLGLSTENYGFMAFVKFCFYGKNNEYTECKYLRDFLINSVKYNANTGIYNQKFFKETVATVVLNTYSVKKEKSRFILSHIGWFCISPISILRTVKKIIF